MELLTAVQLNKEQANFFALCNQNFEAIGFMASSGVFQIRGGNAILSFDPKGYLKSIKKELYTYANSMT